MYEKTINGIRKKYTNLQKMNLINNEYIDYEKQLIFKLDKLQLLNPELVDRVHDWYMAKRNIGNWSPRWIK